MKWKTSRSAAENARLVLPKLAEKYFDAGRNAARGEELSAQDLHRFRIATKRFRYSLEIFRPVYGASLEARIGTLRKLQDVLGQLSDYHSMERLFDGEKELERNLERAFAKKFKEFRDMWAAFDSGQQLKKWKAYLAHVSSEKRT
jgi:CHAD domain-containing protein